MDICKIGDLDEPTRMDLLFSVCLLRSIVRLPNQAYVTSAGCAVTRPQANTFCFNSWGNRDDDRCVPLRSCFSCN